MRFGQTNLARTRSGWLALCGLVAGASAVAGARGKIGDIWNTVDLEAFAREATTITVHSIDPAMIEEEGEPKSVGTWFHHYGSLGSQQAQETGELAAVRTAVLQALQSIQWDDEPYMCFEPRHGLRLEKGGEVLDFLLCFECENSHVYYRGEYQLGPIGRLGQEELNAFLDKHAIPRVRPPERATAPDDGVAGQIDAVLRAATSVTLRRLGPAAAEPGLRALDDLVVLQETTVTDPSDLRVLRLTLIDGLRNAPAEVPECWEPAHAVVVPGEPETRITLCFACNRGLLRRGDDLHGFNLSSVPEGILEPLFQRHGLARAGEAWPGASAAP